MVVSWIVKPSVSEGHSLATASSPAVEDSVPVEDPVPALELDGSSWTVAAGGASSSAPAADQHADQEHPAEQGDPDHRGERRDVGRAVPLVRDGRGDRRLRRRRCLRRHPRLAAPGPAA